MSSATKGRIDVIDAIRGFAVFGILLANIHSWSGYRFLPFTEIALLPYADLDTLLYGWNKLLVDSKFYAIFSLLFGVGFGLQWERKREHAATFLPVYRRRMAFLLLFGFLHMLLWSGDILMLYALLSFVMISLRNLSPRAQLQVGVALMFAFVISQVGVWLIAGPAEIKTAIAHKTYPDMSWEVVIAGLASDSWRDMFAVNLHNTWWRWHDFLPNGRISRILGFFLIGVYLARSGFFTGAATRPITFAILLTTGLVMTWVSLNMGVNQTAWLNSPAELVPKLGYVFGQLLMALGYMCGLTLAFGTRLGRWLMHPLTLIGRTAFTSYLSQTVIGVAIFYGVGFGLVATMGLAQLLALAVAIYAGQVVFASVWLKFFRQGPVEWLWRCLTQKELLPNRRHAA